jgi:hypothetical protein
MFLFELLKHVPEIWGAFIIPRKTQRGQAVVRCGKLKGVRPLFAANFAYQQHARSLKIDLQNDGPVTIIIDSKTKE